MLNKLKFNNLVISNTKYIQESRIQTINKLVHKVRKLKSLSEKQPENMKYKNRIRKSTETMEVLKKRNKIDIMKKILLMKKPGSAIVTNGLATPEEVAIALLSMNKIMQELVKRFKTELEINKTESDDWKQVLMESSKRKRKIERTELKRKKRLESKMQKVMDRKRQEWLEENQANINENLPLDPVANISTSGNWHIDELSNDMDMKVVDDEKVVKKPINTGTKEKRNKHKLDSKQAIPNKIRKLENISISDSELLEERMQSCRLNENLDMSDTNQSEKSYNKEESENSLVIDPFFITGTGENYLSTATSKNEIVVEENVEKKRLHKINNDFEKKPFECNDRRNQKTQQNGSKRKNERDQHNRNYKIVRNDQSNRNQRNDKNGVQKRQENSNKKTHIDNKSDKSLHPSWAAKQKFRPVVTEFQGKKITFEDNLSQKNPRPENDIKKQQMGSIKVNNPENEKLHPSWLAKQKQKPSITTFQGKKIIFSNDE